MTDTWIDHDGSECPVPPDTLVETRRRDLMKAGPLPARIWSVGTYDWWRHEGDNEYNRRNHIIAYRIIGDQS